MSNSHACLLLGSVRIFLAIACASGEVVAAPPETDSNASSLSTDIPRVSALTGSMLNIA